MKRTYTALWILTTVLATTAQSNPAIGQNASPPSAPAGVPPTFSIADVHAPPQSKATYMNLSMVNHDRFVLDHATMIDMIPLAYKMDRNEVFCGPSWLDNNRDEIAALVPRDTKFPTPS